MINFWIKIIIAHGRGVPIDKKCGEISLFLETMNYE